MDLIRPRMPGLAAALATVTIWAAFMLVTRFAVQGRFTVEEILILRLVPGALVMAPVMWRLGVIPHGQSWPRAAILMVGASAVFPYVVSNGLTYAPASDGGALAPGMLPFWTALAAYFISGEVTGPRRMLGLVMILSGAMIVSLWQIFAGADDGAWKGHVMFLTGSGCFAIYSVIFRQSGLSPLHSLVIGLFWGTLLVTPLFLATGFVAQIGCKAVFPFPQTDLPYCLSDGYAKRGVAIEHSDADLDLCDLPFEVPRHQRLAE